MANGESNDVSRSIPLSGTLLVSVGAGYLVMLGILSHQAFLRGFGLPPGVLKADPTELIALEAWHLIILAGGVLIGVAAPDAPGSRGSAGG